MGSIYKIYPFYNLLSLIYCFYCIAYILNDKTPWKIREIVVPKWPKLTYNKQSQQGYFYSLCIDFLYLQSFCLHVQKKKKNPIDWLIYAEKSLVKIKESHENMASLERYTDVPDGQLWGDEIIVRWDYCLWCGYLHWIIDLFVSKKWFPILRNKTLTMQFETNVKSVINCQSI